MTTAKANSPGRTSPQPRIPLRRRVKAWWDGEELSFLQRPETAATVASDEQELINLDLTAFLQDLWGPGAHQSSQNDFELTFLRPLALNPAMTVTNIGAGFGLLSRMIAEDFGAWVQGFENNDVFVDVGMELSKRAGLEKKAAVRKFDPETHAFPENKADCVVSREFLYRVADRSGLLNRLHAHLKDYGQLLFTDFVLRENANPEDIAPLLALEANSPTLWTQKEYETILSDLKLDVRISENITDLFEPMTTAAWAKFVDSDKAQNYGSDTARILRNEVEIWTERTKAFRAGLIELRRFHCLKSVWKA